MNADELNSMVGNAERRLNHYPSAEELFQRKYWMLDAQRQQNIREALERQRMAERRLEIDQNVHELLSDTWSELYSLLSVFDREIRETCEACEKPFYGRPRLNHHVSYFPEDIVEIHRSCHMKIHRTDKYPDLKPPEGDYKRFIETRKVQWAQKKVAQAQKNQREKWARVLKRKGLWRGNVQ